MLKVECELIRKYKPYKPDTRDILNYFQDLHRPNPMLKRKIRARTGRSEKAPLWYRILGGESPLQLERHKTSPEPASLVSRQRTKGLSSWMEIRIKSHKQTPVSLRVQIRPIKIGNDQYAPQLGNG